MGKTLGSIITLAGAIVVNAIPGLGQIASAAILAGSFIAGSIVSGLGGGGSRPETQSTSVKQPRPPRVSAYGVSKLAMAYALYETGTNGHAVDVGAVHDGRMDGVVQLYLNDDKVTVAGAYVQSGADGRYGNDNIRLLYTDGSAPGMWFNQVGAIVPEWTSNHRGDGVVMLAMIAKNVKEKDYLKFYPNGAPTASMVARWQRCPNLRAADPLNEAGWTWTENPIRQLAHYMLVRECPQPTVPATDPAYPATRAALRAAFWNAKIGPALGYWQAAQDVCDEPVPMKAGGTEPRYRSCVAHSHTDSHKQVRGAILATCDGWMAPRADGAYVVYAGRVYEPTVTIGPEQIASFEWNGVGVDDDKAINEFVCTYISDQHDYASVETDAWTDEDDIAERGQLLSTTLDLPVPSHGQIRRLAKREMARRNAVFRGTITTTVEGRAVRGHRFIHLALRVAGRTYFDGPVEITGLTRNIESGGVTFTWVAVSSNVDSWNPATEEGNPAATADRVAGEPLPTPTVTSAVAAYDTVSDAGSGVRVTITAEGLNREDVTWYARWRKVGDSAWSTDSYPDIDAGPSVTLLTGFVPTNGSVEVEVAYGTGDGRLSAWSSAVTANTATDATPPEDAAGVTLVNWSDSLDLSTAAIPRASSYRWRFYDADGTTLVRTINTSIPSVSYTAAQAELDGTRRQYIVKVAGVNAAGAGDEASTSILTNAAPSAVTGVSATGGATEAQVAFTLLTEADVAGYVVYVSNTAGFNPLSQGTAFYNNGASPAYLQGLASGTFYAKIAAFDAWTRRPDLLNFSSEVTFAITTGGGGVGGGGGGGGGGYCVTTDTCVLLADGSTRAAGELAVGDMLWTQHETTFEWGAHPVEAIEIVEDAVFAADIGERRTRATAGHLMLINGSWIRMDAIGTPAGRAMVAKITVADAHTYVANGILHHNIKYQPLEPGTD
ncbi:Hint domain-containing protein [Sphingomonas sp.]|uniref:Hint domain-containing protein n=1 Tax=Sphingomonas sp. TaxID=28214 RepID=UPI002FDB8F0C